MASSLSVTSDLSSNKDALLYVSTFLSIKQLTALRGVCKQFNSWLSDTTSFSWKKRIELSFPTNYQAVMGQSANEQMAKLQVFDSLVESGQQAAFFSLPSLLDVPSVELGTRLQLPWNCRAYVVTYNKTSAVILKNGKVTSRLDLPEMKSVDAIYFDFTNEKVGLVNRETGALKRYLVEDCEFKHDADFTCDALKSANDKKLNRIYGDYIVVHKHSSRLAWHSLSANKEVRELELPESDGLYLAVSEVSPVIYVSETSEDNYIIHEIDCNLGSDEIMEEICSGDLRIEMDNCGDGVAGIKLIETEDGKVLNIYLMGTGDRAYKVLDLNHEEVIWHMYFGEFGGYSTIQYNPGTEFYCLTKGNGDTVVAVMEGAKSHATEWFGKSPVKELPNEGEDENASDEEEEEHEYASCDEENESDDPTDGAYFKIQTDRVLRRKWLNKDILAINATFDQGEQQVKRQLFFSISKRAVIGWIEDVIAEVFISGNQIVAVKENGDFYRVTLAANVPSESTKEVQEKEPEDVSADKQKELNGSNKKRTLSEMEDDQSEAQQPPMKKQKICV